MITSFEVIIFFVTSFFATTVAVAVAVATATTFRFFSQHKEKNHQSQQNQYACKNFLYHKI